MSPRPKAVVIGGGVAGLASAALLAREGHDVELHDKGTTLGGRAGRWHSHGFAFDTGPSWYLMPEVFDHFYRLLGTTAERELDLVRLDPAYRVFFEGDPTPLDLRSEREHVVSTFESISPGAGQRIGNYLDSARHTYDLALERFLYFTYESWLPLLRSDVVRSLPRLLRLLGQPLDGFITGQMRDHRIAQVLGYPAVFLGTSPGRAPSLYHLMSHLDLVDGVFYPMGGFADFVDSLERLARAEGVRVHSGSTVTRVTTSPHEIAPTALRARLPGARRPTARVTGVDIAGPDGVRRHVPAEVVVAATDLHHLDTDLLPPALREHSTRWWSRRDPGPGAVLVMLGVRGELPSLAHHSLLFTRDWDTHFEAMHGTGTAIPDPACLYVSRASATDPGVAPPGDEALFILVPVAADPGLGKGGVDGAGDAAIEQIATAAIAQIASWADIPDLAERIVVRRTIGPGDFADDVNAWSGGALGPAHTLRQSAFLRGRTRSSTVAGLRFAGHGTIPGIGLPMCLISAEVMLKGLRGDSTTGPLTEPLASANDRGRAP